MEQTIVSVSSVCLTWLFCPLFSDWAGNIPNNAPVNQNLEPRLMARRRLGVY
jgi:hypothetical protein